MTTRTNAVNSGNAKSSANKGLCFTKEQLIEMHWIQGLSLTAIGKQYGVTAQAVKYWINKYGIEHRSKVQDVLFEPSPTLSYVFGVLHGDGFLYKHPASRCEILLAVVDKPFAESFKRALNILGLRANIVSLKPRNERCQPQVKVYACSKKFHELWFEMTSSERLDFGLRFPRDFLRGLYESEGSVKFHRGTLELCIYSTNVEMQKAILSTLKTKGFSPKWYERTLESGKQMVYVQLFRSLEIKRFLAWITPCIKYQPRSRRQANREPSRGGDISEGVETTKSDPGGR